MSSRACFTRRTPIPGISSACERRRWQWGSRWKHAAAVPQQATATSLTDQKSLPSHEVVQLFYLSYNTGDFSTLATLFAEDCSYHDMIYEQPFCGRQAVIEYFAKVRGVVGGELQFIVEDITAGDPGRVGVRWHVETSNGVEVLFSRGCSFYTLNEQGQITSARDLVESAIKPGSSTLRVLGLVAPLLKTLGPGASPTSLPVAAALVWAFYFGYTSFVFFSPQAPGLPLLQTPPEVLQEVLHESLNFFYVNIFLADWGLSPVPSIPAPPVSEALFNFVAAWGMMFLPLMLTDPRGAKVQNKVPWWLGILFLTNVFFIPYLALRAAPEPPSTPAPSPPPPMPSWVPAMGGVGAAIGVASICWAAAARPEYGNLAARWQYFVDTFSSNRAFFAFVLDSSLYCIWQYDMMKGAPTALRSLPFFGLAAWLLTGASRQGSEEAGEGKGASS